MRIKIALLPDARLELFHGWLIRTFGFWESKIHLASAASVSLPPVSDECCAHDLCRLSAQSGHPHCLVAHLVFQLRQCGQSTISRSLCEQLLYRETRHLDNVFSWPVKQSGAVVSMLAEIPSLSLGSAMNSFEPTTTSYALFSMPLDEAASALTAFFSTGALDPVQSDLEGKADELFPNLEPLSMASDRALLVANGKNWTSYFNNSLLGSDVFLEVSWLARAHSCTGLRIVKKPKATIFEAYNCPERGGQAPNNCRRSIYAAPEGKWTFGSSGAPYPFEDVSRYEAKSIRDRFTPETLDYILRGLGAPHEPFPVCEKLIAKLFVFDGRAPQLPRWTYAEVQAGQPWKPG